MTTLNQMIEQRANREAVKQAQSEVDAIEADLKAALDKIGVDMYYLPSAHQFIAAARLARIDGLVHARLQAVADALMAPAHVSVTVSGHAHEMREALGQIVRNTQRTADYLDNVTDGGNAIRTQA